MLLNTLWLLFLTSVYKILLEHINLHYITYTAEEALNNPKSVK